jgi:hypothetical protein
MTGRSFRSRGITPMSSIEMEVARRLGAFGQVEYTERVYLENSSAEVERRRAEARDLEQFAVEVSDRMRAKQGPGSKL